jgi:hypothetical protein
MPPKHTPPRDGFPLFPINLAQTIDGVNGKLGPNSGKFGFDSPVANTCGNQPHDIGETMR